MASWNLAVPATHFRHAGQDPAAALLVKTVQNFTSSRRRSKFGELNAQDRRNTPRFCCLAQFKSTEGRSFSHAAYMLLWGMWRSLQVLGHIKDPKVHAAPAKVSWLITPKSWSATL